MATFNVGDRVRLISRHTMMGGSDVASSGARIGDVGTATSTVDPDGDIHVKWDRADVAGIYITRYAYTGCVQHVTDSGAVTLTADEAAELAIIVSGAKFDAEERVTKMARLYDRLTEGQG